MVIQCLFQLNLVEWFKQAFRRLRRKAATGRLGFDSQTSDALITDLFVAAKWLFLILALVFEWFATPCVVAVVYLLLMNLFTYFYYHAWRIMELTPHLTVTHIQRRMVNAILAVGYSMLSFAFLYAGPLRSDMGLAKVGAYRLEAIIFSFSNSLTVGYGVVSPATTWARATCVSQLVNMFLFGSIILAASLSSMFGAAASSGRK